MSQLKELRQARASMRAHMESLIAKLGDAEFDDEDGKLEADLEATKKKLSMNSRLIEQAEALAEESKASLLIEDELPRVEPTPKRDAGKFGSFGEQLAAIAHAFGHGVARDERDPRLGQMQPGAAASGQNEAVPSDGGFLVQQDFSDQLLGLMHESGELWSRVRNITISTNANGISMPAIDETSRADGSRFGGVRAYWVNEADTVLASKVKFRTVDLKLEKLMAIGYATEEILADSAILEQVMTRAFTEEMVFKVENSIINGTGSGQPLGILNSGALVSQAIESGQAAATVNTFNVLKMWGRLPMRNRRTAVWLVNQDVEQVLYQLVLAGGTAADMLVFTPSGERGNTGPYALLMGRPVIPIEYAPTLGTAGDMILFDPQEYVLATKGGVKQAQSMHVRFLYDEQAFRFTMRVDGQPIWRTPLTPFKGSVTQSPFVTIATRS